MDNHAVPDKGEAEKGFDQVMLRRLAAAAVDLGFVVGAGVASAALLVERFSMIRADNNQATFSTADQAQINEMTGLLSRGYEIGDTLLALSTVSVLLIALSIVAASIAIGVLVPMIHQGQSVGKTIFGLRVVGTDGSSPQLSRYVVRTVAALADLMPIVVPGLTGFAFAASNPSHQRIGDRLAKTMVIDSDNHQLSLAKTEPLAIHQSSFGDETPIETPPAEARVSLSAVAHPRHFLTDGTKPELNSRPQPPDHIGDHSSELEVSATLNPVHPGRISSSNSQDHDHGDLVEMSDSIEAQRQRQPSVAPTAAHRVPVEERSTNPYPKPKRPVRAEAPPPKQTPGAQPPVEVSSAQQVEPPTKPTASVESQAAIDRTDQEINAGYDSLALPESSLSDMPLTNTALFEALGLSAEDIAKLGADFDDDLADAVTATEPDRVEQIDAVPYGDDSSVPEGLRPKEPLADHVPEISSAQQLTRRDLVAEPPTTPADLNPPRPREQGDRRAVQTPVSGFDPIQPPADNLTSVSPQQRSTPVQGEPVWANAAPPQPLQATPAQTPPVHIEPVQATPAQVAPTRVAPTHPVPAQTRSPRELPVYDLPNQRGEPALPRVQYITADVPQAASPQPAPGSHVQASPTIHAQPIVEQAPAQRPVKTEPTRSNTQVASPRRGSAPAPDKRAPMWSEDWEAWIYWDTTLRTWFRHDEDSDNWVPMEG